MDENETNVWQILDVGSIWMKEFAYALSGMARVVSWVPKMGLLGMFQGWHRPLIMGNPELTMLQFPLQRGYARAPLRWLAPFQGRMIKRMLAQTSRPEESPLICTTPFYAPVAELWSGPVVYYVTDMTAKYEGLDCPQVEALDRRMCRVAQAVCPNSRRIAEYLVNRAGCDEKKITVVPNATRASNVAASPQIEPGELPHDVQDLPRPIVGVLGNLSGNMNWELTTETMKRTPQLSWLFVGPAIGVLANAKQHAARDWAKVHGRFVGMKPYGELQKYARCLDAAVLPYQKREPTFSGSSTRFYEHLAAGRPIIATRGLAELIEKVPLVTLVDTPEEMALALENLRLQGFRDGMEDGALAGEQDGDLGGTCAVHPQVDREERESQRTRGIDAGGCGPIEKVSTVVPCGASCAKMDFKRRSIRCGEGCVRLRSV